MKINKLFAVCACATLATATINMHNAVAQPGHAHGGQSKTPIPDTAEGILQEIQKHHVQVTTAVKEKKLQGVHGHAEAMTALAKALPDKVTEEKKARVQGSANNLTKLVDIMHHAADEGDQVRAAIELKKLDGVMMALEKQIK